MIGEIKKSSKLFKDLKKIIKSEDEIFIEGKKLLYEALKSNYLIKKIFVDKKNKDLISDLNITKNDTEIIYLENDLISSLFTTKSSPTKDNLICAIAETKKYDFINIIKKSRNLILLENIQDPGNLGSIFRSALAFNISGIILSLDSANPYNTKVIRSSAGAVFNIPFVNNLEITHIVKELKLRDFKIVSTSSKSNKKINFNTNDKHLIVFGNEGKGISSELKSKCDLEFKIPHSDKVESLNLSVSASIVFWELYKTSL